MTTKIKYRFINGDVLEVEVDDSIAAYILMDRIREASANRKERRHTKKIKSEDWDHECFATQWGNPENYVIDHEKYESLIRMLEGLTYVQKRRLILRLSGFSYREIARQEKVSVQSISESIEGVRKKILNFLVHKIDE